MTGCLITADELALRLQSAHPPVVLDARWSLAEPDGRPGYLAGHIPGAVYASVESELAHVGDPAEGRHPLPSTEELQAAARRWGLNPGQAVVAYDLRGGHSAARAWWLLRDAGVADVRVLDGGLESWTDSGRALETGEVVVAPGSVVLSSGHMPVLSIGQVEQFAKNGVLLDARAAERYRGEVEPVDKYAGHIPGAVSAPTSANLDAEGKFLAPAELARNFAKVGATVSRSVAAYCGSGVSASHEVLALAIAGIPAALFPGSWSAWVNQPNAPVAVGPLPDAERSR